MKTLLVLTMILFFSQSFAQSKTEIKQNGISVKKTFEQDIDEGEKKLLLEKEEYFNSDGELIEIKTFSEKGRIKSWKKFTFNTDGLLVEEQKLNYRGVEVERIEYKYENGLKVQKLYFDNKNRMFKKKQYEYIHSK